MKTPHGNHTKPIKFKKVCKKELYRRLYGTWAYRACAGRVPCFPTLRLAIFTLSAYYATPIDASHVSIDTKSIYLYIFFRTSLLRLVVRTSGFHPDNRGSTPLGDGIKRAGTALFILEFCIAKLHEAMLQGESNRSTPGKVANASALTNKAGTWMCRGVRRRP